MDSVRFVDDLFALFPILNPHLCLANRFLFFIKSIKVDVLAAMENLSDEFFDLFLKHLRA